MEQNLIFPFAKDDGFGGLSSLDTRPRLHDIVFCDQRRSPLHIHGTYVAQFFVICVVCQWTFRAQNGSGGKVNIALSSVWRASGVVSTVLARFVNGYQHFQ